MVPWQDVSNLDIVIGQTDKKAGTIPVISSAHLRTNIYERIEMTDKNNVTRGRKIYHFLASSKSLSVAGITLGPGLHM